MADSEFVSVADMASDFLTNAKAKIAQWQADAARDHANRMAGLPPGTCERCYGQGCPDCQPVDNYAAGVPHEFHDVTLDSYGAIDGQHTAIQKARAFCDATDGRDLYLFGDVGAGKTRLASAIANEMHRRRRLVQFVNVPILLHQLQPGRDNGELEDRITVVHVLVLDDLGAERDQATDYTRRTLHMLYEARHNAGKRTVFTSNKSIQQISDMQADDRLSSRIAGRADVVRLTAPDQRRLRRVR